MTSRIAEIIRKLEKKALLMADLSSKHLEKGNKKRYHYFEGARNAYNHCRIMLEELD